MENKVYCTLRSGGKEHSRSPLSLGTTNLPYCIYIADVKYLVTVQVLSMIRGILEYWYFL